MVTDHHTTTLIAHVKEFAECFRDLPTEEFAALPVKGKIAVIELRALLPLCRQLCEPRTRLTLSWQDVLPLVEKLESSAAALVASVQEGGPP